MSFYTEIIFHEYHYIRISVLTDPARLRCLNMRNKENTFCLLIGIVLLEIANENKQNAKIIVDVIEKRIGMVRI